MSYRNGKNYVETGFQKTTPTKPSIPGDGRAAHSKMATFIPPFFKNAKTESCKRTVLKDNMRTSSAFVPPFKKQRSIVQEGSSKPQEEDKLHHLSVTAFNSNNYVPPTKKTQSTTDVTGNKSKEDIQRVALADTTNNKLRNNQNHPVGCGSEDYAAEASCVEDTLSRSQGVVTFLDEVNMIQSTLHNIGKLMVCLWSTDTFLSLHNVELARDMQDMRIRKKKRQTIRPLPGSLFLTKTSGVSRIPLKAAGNGKPPARYTQKQARTQQFFQ